jgi:hypothetical protein
LTTTKPLSGRVWDAYQRGKTWYTLTDHAAYIASDTFGRRSLKRYGMAELQAPDLQDEAPGSVYFADEIGFYHTSYMGRTRTQTKPVGFRRITDARKVYRLIASQREEHQNARSERS